MIQNQVFIFPSYQAGKIPHFGGGNTEEVFLPCLELV